ncbi:MAG: TlpA family protein disulfide reductase [Candidatus Kapabacteria bacterium]|nr:TlpA family protein disulfide reductase [Ignavibacteriota bacterium]MCW5885920.1 TlpA family protein disulfide reductase [Candidatus Kapabacteria bacterium]
MKYILILVFLLNVSLLYSENRAKITFIFDSSAIQLDTSISVAYYDHLIDKRVFIDSFSMKSGIIEQTFEIKTDGLRYYEFFISDDEYLTVLLMNNSDSAVISISYNINEDTYSDSIVFTSNKVFDYFNNKFVWRVSYKGEDSKSYSMLTSHLKRIDSVYNYNYSIFEKEFLNDENLSEQDKRFMLGTLTYSKYSNLSRFIFYTYYYNKDTVKEQLNEDIRRFVDKMLCDEKINNFDINDRLFDHGILLNYHYMLLNIIEFHFYHEFMIKDFVEFHTYKLDKYSQLFNGNFRARVLYKYMNDKIEDSRSMKDVLVFENLVKKYTEYLVYDYYKSKLLESIERVKELRSNNIIGEYELIDTLNNKVSFSDYKGKFIYVSFWASWCSSCHQNFDALKKLISEYQNTNLEILNIAIDKLTLDKWKKNLNKYNLTGTQLIYAGNFFSPLCKDLKIGSLPHFMILDTEGRIINFKADYPDSPKLIDELKRIGVK